MNYARRHLRFPFVAKWPHPMAPFPSLQLNAPVTAGLRKTPEGSVAPLARHVAAQGGAAARDNTRLRDTHSVSAPVAD